MFIYSVVTLVYKLKQNSNLSDLKLEIELLKEKIRIIEIRQNEAVDH